jgi:hypothetical protein
MYPFPQFWSGGGLVRKLTGSIATFSEVFSLLKAKFLGASDTFGVTGGFEEPVRELRDAPTLYQDYILQFAEAVSLLKQKYLLAADSASLLELWDRTVELRDLQREVAEVAMFTDTHTLTRIRNLLAADSASLLELWARTVELRDLLRQTSKTVQITESHSLSKQRWLVRLDDGSLAELYSRTAEGRDMSQPAVSHSVGMTESYSLQKTEVKPASFYGDVQESSCEFSTVNVELWWSNAGFSGAMTLERKLSAASTWTVVNSNIASGSTYYLDTGLTKNATYNYRLKFNGSSYYSTTNIFTICVE